jgi:hypothetical protein
MSVADEIVAIPAGARFYRADMHIHSFGGSHDVKDSSMTPGKIVETAVAEGLGVIAITDHNEIHNVSALLAAASGRILAVPGVELSTPEGHLLVYFEDLSNLVEYYGRLTFAGKGTENSRCQTSMLECIQRIEHGRGFAILAHVDGSGGLEHKVQGYPPHKADILASPTLLGIELQTASSQVSYSPNDNEPQRAAIGKQRIDKLNLGQKQFLARVLFSDSHSLQALGRNAQGNRKVTRIKMDSPSFHGLRIALEDSDARIRLEDEIPVSVPYVLGVKLEGGFLDGQIIHLSRNLNCIIGGRGAGKSTVFETIRICSSHPSPSKNVDSEIWPEIVRIVWVDQAGQQHTINKRAGMEPQNIDDPVLGPASCSIEAYGQNETAQTSFRAQSDPNALLEYLDQFIDFGDAKIADEALRGELLANQTLIEKAQTEVAKLPEFRKLLANVQQQLQALEKAKAPEIVALERQVAEERSLRSNLERKISDLSIHAKYSNVLETLGEIRKLVPGQALKVGASEYSNVLSLVAAFEADAKNSQAIIAEKAQILSDSAKRHLEQWRIREQQIVEQIEAKRKELAAQGVRLDMAYIRKLASDEAGYKKSLENLLTWEPHLADLKRNRLELLKKRTLARSKVSTSRVVFGKKADLALKDALGDLTVSVKFAEAALSAQGEEVVQRAMNWRTVQVPRAPLLLDQVPLPQLLDCIKRNNLLHSWKLKLRTA